ncbi:MAG TPA: hypothetical protein VFE25_07735 [Opitutaceae bacterium]|nr:hypothetical protein [Opitutaceae bacterium]
MSDKTKSGGASRGLSATIAASRGMSEPDIVDFLPLPVYPLLGVQVHCVRWQKIVQGMKKKRVVVRVHRESDRGGLFKAASRLDVKLTSRRCSGGPGEGASWLVRVREASGRNAADIDAADPTASDRGRYRALGLLVLQRGSLSLQGEDMAIALHRSLREYIRDNGLAARRQRNAVVATPMANNEFVVSVAPNIRSAYADREKNKSPAA